MKIRKWSLKIVHESAYSFVASIVEKTKPFRTVPMQALDIGGRDINGTVRTLWPRANWTVLDIQDGNDVDIVADATTWTPEPYEAYDLVVCTEVLEHVENWRAIVKNAVDALAVGGHLVITCAGPGRERHGMDGNELPKYEHYENIVASGLASCLLECHGLMWRSLVFDPIDRDLYFYGVKGWSTHH